MNDVQQAAQEMSLVTGYHVKDCENTLTDVIAAYEKEAAPKPKPAPKKPTFAETMKRRYPTMTRVVSSGADVSRAMRDARHKAQRRKRVNA